MEWTQVLTIVGVNIALIGAMATLVVWAVNRVDADVKSICSRMDKMDNRFDSHAQRIDQLYKMFIDLLKERNQQ